MIKNKNIFITGGAGFIASKLIEALAEHNHITVYDNYLRNTLINTRFNSHPNVTQVEGDVLDAAKLAAAMSQANIIVHAAAIAGIDSTVKNPVETMRVNILGTANLLEAAQKLKSVERVVEFSTSEVFGSYAYKVDEATQTVTGAVGEARWTYAVSKLAGEHLTNAYHKQYGLPTVTLRPFNVYGPGQTGEGALSIFIRRALRDENIFIFGEGSQIRAWCYVDDMVKGVLCAMEDKNAIGQSFNIGNARAVTTIFGLAEAICRILKSNSKIIFKEALSADIELRIPSVSKSKKLLDFEAKIDLDEGIRRTAEWIHENHGLLPELAPIFKDN